MRSTRRPLRPRTALRIDTSIAQHRCYTVGTILISTCIDNGFTTGSRAYTSSFFSSQALRCSGRPSDTRISGDASVRVRIPEHRRCIAPTTVNLIRTAVYYQNGVQQHLVRRDVRPDRSLAGHHPICLLRWRFHREVAPPYLEILPRADTRSSIHLCCAHFSRAA